MLSTHVNIKLHIICPQVVVLPSFSVLMVSASPLPSDAMGSVGDVLMVVMKPTAVRLLDTYIFFRIRLYGTM